ncbi:GPP34 family phosphoprotein [Streptomyces sp. NPDC051018]|uniref:GOLPH3/VPS74 family protein n=1 Tax=Streptomyces sp. NPDC051018 TaxID=3365639 RepID=UPI0037AA6D08
MTTARDLMITAVDAAADRPVSQGELSLALAGAELVDLLGEGAVILDADLIVPAGLRALGDPLLDQATASVTRDKPYESVEDWLWRRGRDLVAAYAAALAAEGQLTRQGRRWLSLLTGRTVVSNTAEHQHARERWAAHEPALAALAAAVGIVAADANGDSHPVDGPAGIVLAGVADAVTELGALRQQRSIEQDAFDNIWRAP